MEKLFVLAGKARSGKDTVADFMEKYYSDKKIIRLMYSGWLKGYASIISDWDGSEETKPRDLLQKLAFDSRKVNPGYTLKRMQEDVNILRNYADIVIITDARLPEEVIMPKESFPEAITIKLVRNNFESSLNEKQKNDFTETALDKYADFDLVIDNDGTLDDLEETVKKLIEKDFC